MHSVLGVLGLRNPDVILEVEGRPLSTPDEALAAFAAIRSLTEIHLHVERQGAPVELVYHVTP